MNQFKTVILPTTVALSHDQILSAINLAAGSVLGLQGHYLSDILFRVDGDQLSAEVKFLERKPDPEDEEPPVPAAPAPIAIAIPQRFPGLPSGMIFGGILGVVLVLIFHTIGGLR